MKKNEASRAGLAFVFALLAFALSASHALGDEANEGAKKSGGKMESTGATDEFVSSSTQLDFNDTMIDGKFKAPQGFMLSGRQSQSLTQMVKLRSNFRNELKNSGAVVKSLVK